MQSLKYGEIVIVSLINIFLNPSISLNLLIMLLIWKQQCHQ